MSLKCNLNIGKYNIVIGRRGDCSGALSLWTSLQDLDVTPSSQFLTMLAELLRSHKMEVPFVVTPTEEWPVQPKTETVKNSSQRSSPYKCNSTL
jgi:hypothetical protein